MNKKIKLSALKEDKEYKADCQYWSNSIFFKRNGRLMYRRGDSVHKTTYDMYPGLSRCTFSEHIDMEEIDRILLGEPSFLFLDDYIDDKLGKYDELVRRYKYNHIYKPPELHEYLGMALEEWSRYLFDRVDRRAHFFEGDYKGRWL